jgi:hypothetical protein
LKFLLGFISLTLSPCSLFPSKFARLQRIKLGAIARCNLEVTQLLFMELGFYFDWPRSPGTSSMAKTVSALWGKVGTYS